MSMNRPGRGNQEYQEISTRVNEEARLGQTQPLPKQHPDLIQRAFEEPVRAQIEEKNLDLEEAADWYARQNKIELPSIDEGGPVNVYGEPIPTRKAPDNLVLSWGEVPDTSDLYDRRRR